MKYKRSKCLQRLSLFTVSLLLIACASNDLPVGQNTQGPSSDDQTAVRIEDSEPMLTVEEILNQDPRRQDYVEERNCISAQRIRDVKVLDEQHVVFNMRRGKHYLVQFKHRCFGLKPNRPISYEISSSQLCRFDAIRGVEDFAGRLQPGQRCRIPGFQSISEEQVVSLKANLKSEKQRLRDERKARREAEHEARKAKRKV